MAIYHLHASIGKRQTGQSAKAKAAYIQREGHYTHGRDDLLYAASGHMPAWAKHQPTRYWEAADLYERANGKLFYQVEFALPIELNAQQQIALAHAFAEHLTRRPNDVAGPLPYTLAIHTGDDANPHCHLLISERANDGLERDPTQWFKRADPHYPERGGAAKTRTLQPKEWLLQTRQVWEHQANQTLEITGHTTRINRRTLKAQGINRLPQLHLGPPVLHMEQRGLRTDRGDQALQIERLNSPVLALIYREIPTHERDRARPLVDRGAELAAVDRGGDHGLDRRGGSAERIRALAEPLQYDRSGGSELAGVRAEVPTVTGRQAEVDRPSNGLEPTLDRTYLAARRQLQAMGAERFEIGIRDGKTGRMLTRTWTLEETLNAVLWLKRENAKGADIYVRPAGEQNQGLVLLDDLTRSAIERLKRDQLAPAAVIETSLDNFQAWIRLSQPPLPPAVATTAVKHLAQEYGSDPNSADWRHFGRLAGFTNRKPIHQDEHGHSPYVLAHECNGHTAEQGQQLIQQAREQVRQAELRQAQKHRLEAVKTASERVYGQNPVGRVPAAAQTALSALWAVCGPVTGGLDDLQGYGTEGLQRSGTSPGPRAGQPGVTRSKAKP